MIKFCAKHSDTFYIVVSTWAYRSYKACKLYSIARIYPVRYILQKSRAGHLKVWYHVLKWVLAKLGPLFFKKQSIAQSFLFGFSRSSYSISFLHFVLFFRLQLTDWHLKKWDLQSLLFNMNTSPSGSKVLTNFNCRISNHFFKFFQSQNCRHRPFRSIFFQTFTIFGLHLSQRTCTLFACIDVLQCCET